MNILSSGMTVHPNEMLETNSIIRIRNNNEILVENTVVKTIQSFVLLFLIFIIGWTN